MLEPPGLLGLNYGAQTPVVAIVAHLALRRRPRALAQGALTCSTMRDRPIEDYGLLGDTRTAALVGSDGAIDWMCVPRFDGQPVFGRLVGGPDAGTFRLGPAGTATVVARRYRPGTATLETTWDTDGAQLTLTEAMIAEVAGRLLPSTLLVRRLTAEGGPVEAVIEFDPRLGEQHRRTARRHRAATSWCAAGRPPPSRCAARRRCDSNPGGRRR